MIDRETFNDRKARLVLDRQVLQEKLHSESNSASVVIDRVTKFLEQAKTAHTSYISALPYEKRDLIETVTSNRWVSQEQIGIELHLPFQALADWRAFTCGERPGNRRFPHPEPALVPHIAPTGLGPRCNSLQYLQLMPKKSGALVSRNAPVPKPTVAICGLVGLGPRQNALRSQSLNRKE